MTKVALCISGQIRNIEKTYPSIYENIIKPNNADVFIHAWFDKDNLQSYSIDQNREAQLTSDIDKKIIELYKPKKILFEKQKCFANSYSNLYVPDSWKEGALQMMSKTKEKTLDTANLHIIQNSMSMWYSIYKCNELKEEYAVENNFSYDYVIRTRFDLILCEPLYVSNYDGNKLHYININQPDNIVCDWFNFGNNTIMNVYASMYLQIGLLNSYKFIPKNKRLPMTFRPSNDGMWGNEYFIRDMYHLYNIDTVAINPKYSFVYS